MSKARKSAFKESIAVPLIINDSRFGIRKMFLNQNEKPSIKTYKSPGRGQNGEHQN